MSTKRIHILEKALIFLVGCAIILMLARNTQIGEDNLPNRVTDGII